MKILTEPSREDSCPKKIYVVFRGPGHDLKDFFRWYLSVVVFAFLDRMEKIAQSKKQGNTTKSNQFFVGADGETDQQAVAEEMAENGTFDARKIVVRAHTYDTSSNIVVDQTIFFFCVTSVP